MLNQINNTIKKLNDFSLSLKVYTDLIQEEPNVEKISWNNFENLLLERLKSNNGFGQVNFKFNQKIEDDINFKFNKNRLLLLLEILVSNSIRYRDIDKKKCICHVTLSYLIKSKKLKIKVLDNGMGIAEEAKPRLMQMFFKASQLSTGSGLGLYIASNITNEAGGEISIASEENVGTEVTVLMPSFQ